jgi:hypothetical protein
MPVFAILPVDNTKLKPKIESTIPHGDYLFLASNSWLVSYSGTSKELAENLGISPSEGNDTTPGIVVAITSYWGRATPDVWEWLQLKLK